LKRIEQAAPQLYDTLALMLRRSRYDIVNVSAVPILIRYGTDQSEHDNAAYASAARELLKVSFTKLYVKMI
jgi:hypothetical protein